ncbi:hypothetical protein ACFL4L_02835 [bacterium]
MFIKLVVIALIIILIVSLMKKSGSADQLAPLLAAETINPKPTSSDRSLLLHLNEKENVNLTPVCLETCQDIISEIMVTPKGDAIYLSMMREEVEYTHLYDLKYYDIESDRLTKLVDLGSDSSYYGDFIGNTLYRTTSVKSYENHHVLGFRDGKKLSMPNPKALVEFLLPANGKLITQAGRMLYLSDEEQVLGSMEMERDFFSVDWAHPNKNLILLDVRKYNESEGEVDYEYPATYYLVEYDDAFQIIRKEKVLQERKDLEYNNFVLGDQDDLIFIEDIDMNGDGVADYKDFKNSNLLSMDLETLEITRLIEERLELGNIKVHPAGVVFFTNEVEKDETLELTVLDRRDNSQHVILTLEGESYSGFSFNEDYTRLFYQRILDTTGQGKHYSWEDESEIYYVDLVV